MKERQRPLDPTNQEGKAISGSTFRSSLVAIF